VIAAIKQTALELRVLKRGVPMALQSQMFRGDSKLEAAAVSDSAHIFQGARGAHVGKIQLALVLLDKAVISQDSIYGPATAAAVRAFKQKRQILNFQGQIDDIVGKKTIAALDAELINKEKGGVGRAGGARGFADFKVVGDTLTFPNDILNAPVPTRHILVYFSGVADGFGLGGVLLQGAHGKVVLSDMEKFAPPKPTDLLSVIGFGGSLQNSRGVTQALAFIRALHDPRGKLIIYGFSAGGVNALDLCRDLANTSTLGNVEVHMLVTVDVAAGRATSSVNRTVPPVVRVNRNYFQTMPSLNLSRGDANTGRGVQNISFDERFSNLDFFNRHGAMEDLTRAEAVTDMKRALNA
jgi:hypothetical protein